MRNKKGFTLIEMMIVILVIAVLATIVGLAVKNAGTRSKNATLTAHLTTLQNAVDLYNNDCGVYPAAFADLTVAAAAGPAGYQGPYLRTIPPCPWTGETYAVDAAGAVTCSIGTAGP